MDREALYAKSPLLLQRLIIAAEGWRIQRTRFGPPFRAAFRQARERSGWTDEQVKTYRDERLRAFARRAVEQVPYYARTFKAAGLAPEDIRGIDDLAALPVLAKDDVIAHWDEILPRDLDRAKTLAYHTSGTTGAGLKFFVTREAQWEQWAIWCRYRAWHGITLETPCAYFGGRSIVPLAQRKPPYWRYNGPGRQLMFSGYHLAIGTMDAYLDEIERRGIVWLHGYPSLLAALAGMMLDAGRLYKARWVTTGAENLTEHQRSLIERAFGARPFDHYGMAEGVANFSTCTAGKLHVDEDFAAVEFVKNDAGQYAIVGTNFTNDAFPLIRYSVGDVVSSIDESCSCGLPGRVVAGVDGRLEDYVITKSGAYLGRLDHIFKDCVNVAAAQVYQDQPGRMVVRIVKRGSYTADDERLLREEIYKRVGEEVDFSIDYVADIPRTASGKLRMVLSDVASRVRVREPQALGAE